MCARGSKSGVKNETPKSPETRESLGKIGIFLFLKSDFPHTKFDFLQRLSAFFNGFPISLMAFQFLQRLSDFPKQLSAFREIQENLIYGGKYTKDHYLSFIFPATCSPSFVIPANKLPFTTQPCKC
jgi:hypothetical protein